MLHAEFVEQLTMGEAYMAAQRRSRLVTGARTGLSGATNAVLRAFDNAHKRWSTRAFAAPTVRCRERVTDCLLPVCGWITPLR
jgi:hypothetical protein